jgi:hypothetical protein
MTLHRQLSALDLNDTTESTVAMSGPEPSAAYPSQNSAKSSHSEDATEFTVAMGASEPSTVCPSQDSSIKCHPEVITGAVQRPETSSTSPMSSPLSSPPPFYTSLRELSDDWAYAVELWHVDDVGSSIREHRRMLRRLVPTLPTPIQPLQEVPGRSTNARMSIIVEHLWYNVGFLLSHIGDDEDATEAFLESVKRDDKFIISWYGLAMAYCRLRNFRKSSRAFRSIIAVLDGQKVNWIKTNLTIDVAGEFRDPLGPATVDRSSSPVLSELKRKKSWLIERRAIEELNKAVTCLRKNKRCPHGMSSKSICHNDMDWSLPDHITSPPLKASQSDESTVRTPKRTGMHYTPITIAQYLVHTNSTPTGPIRVPHKGELHTFKHRLYDLNEEEEESDIVDQKPALASSQTTPTQTSHAISTAPWHQPGKWQPHVPQMSPDGEVMDLYFQVESLAGNEKELGQGQELSVPETCGEWAMHTNEEGLEILLPRRFKIGGELWEWD